MTRRLAARLNLARRPFVNRRSLWRVVGTLWFVAAILLLTNALLFWRNSAGFADGRTELRRLSSERAKEGEELERLRGALNRFDLAAQNEQVSFLNEKIIERTFPWSRLFDDLVEAMPLEVQLTSLGHRSEDSARRARARPSRRSERSTSRDDEGQWMDLEIAGRATDSEAVLVFLESLFAHPAFAEPDLLNEARQDPGSVSFNLRTRYRVGGAAREGDELLEAAQESGPGESDADELGSETDASIESPVTAGLASRNREQDGVADQAREPSP